MDDFFPIRQAPAAVTQGRVGIVTSSFASSYFSALVDAATCYLLRRDFHVLVQSNMQSRRGELDAWATFEDSDCNALIVHADMLNDDELNLVMQKYPNMVLLNHHLARFTERCIDSDNIAGGEIAARHLVAKGHKKIAMVRGPSEFFETADRAMGFKRELEAHNIELHAELSGNFWQESGESAMERIHNEFPDTTAVFFHNDEMAFGALNACRRLGLRVPDDISVLGFDGIPMCEYVSPTLTSVQIPLRKIGEHAAQIVCDLLSDKKPDKRTVGATYSPVLVERESVSSPADHFIEKIALSQREAECLTWTARGKTSWEISVILGLSESTATFHLRNAGVKLKACNRANAVAKAIYLGLINFSDE